MFNKDKVFGFVHLVDLLWLNTSHVPNITVPTDLELQTKEGTDSSQLVLFLWKRLSVIFIFCIIFHGM